MPANTSKQNTEGSTLQSRREAIRRLGTYARYTAPAMLVLLTADRAMARSYHGKKGKKEKEKRPKWRRWRRGRRH